MDTVTCEHEFDFIDDFSQEEFDCCPDAATDDGSLLDAVMQSVESLKSILAVQDGIRCISRFIEIGEGKTYKVTVLNSSWSGV
jgi:hypothetical protein